DPPEEPDRDAHAQVRVQPARRRPRRAAALRGRSDAPRLRHGRSPRRARRVPREARAELREVPLVLLTLAADPLEQDLDELLDEVLGAPQAQTIAEDTTEHVRDAANAEQGSGEHQRM